jgi:hypothetical protein
MVLAAWPYPLNGRRLGFERMLSFDGEAFEGDDG